MPMLDCFNVGENVWFVSEHQPLRRSSIGMGPFRVRATSAVPDHLLQDAGHIQFVEIEGYDHPISAAWLTRQLPLKSPSAEIFDTGHLRYGDAGITSEYPFKGR